MMNKINKKGDYKYTIIFSLILGLMVLSLSLYFIFNEVWSSNAADREICRQSIQLRSLLPESRLGGYDFKSFKNEFPLKCKTNVKTIDKGDIDNHNAEKIIAESMAECWSLFDKGDASAFPSSIYTDGSIIVRSTCVPCARIHFTDEAKNYIKQNKIKINIRDALNLKMSQGFSYYSYLRDSGKKFSAFNFAAAREFNLSKNRFRVDKDAAASAILHNKLNGLTSFSPHGFDKGHYNPLELSDVSLPEIFNISRGDLLINYGIVTTSIKLDIGDYIPYLFYFQQGGLKNSPFDEIKNRFFDGPLGFNANFCESWEGIPA